MTGGEGYAVALQERARRIGEGWRPVGRKIARTVSLDGLAQPRIEPEICFRLKAVPRSSRVDEVVSCLEWVAHSIEIVQCDRPGWKTSLGHSTAANGLHGRLVVGAPLPVAQVPDLADRLPRVLLELRKGENPIDRGMGENVLGSPLLALGRLVGILEKHAGAPLAAGEIVTTGTLTDAHPVAVGETWSTRLSGIALPGLTVTFA